MKGDGRFTLTSALLTTILLLYAATGGGDAKPQQGPKFYDPSTGRRVQKTQGRPSRSVGSSWAVEVSSGEPENAELLARKHGLTNHGQIGNLRGVYLFSATTAAELGEERETVARNVVLGEMSPSKTTAALETDEMVLFVEEQKVMSRVKRSYVPPSDPGWRKQWSLVNSGQTSGPAGLDINVEAVWMQGINGSDVIVGVVDDGLEWAHTDLIDNYDPLASYDFAWDDEDPSPDENEEGEGPNSHGTSCAGEIAMSRDCSCGVGVAYGCSIGGLKVDFSLISDAVEARALGYKDSHIDVYSNSWGPSDYGFTVEGPGDLLQQTLANGAREGRNGKGSIYVWAAGNGGRFFDSCAADGYVNNVHTVAVGSADQNGLPAFYDEACSAKMAVTFSYNSETFPPVDESWEAHDQVYTTTLGGECTESFTGTSASAPLVTGVVALALQENPDLTWRDVQYLIVYTSNPDILTVDDLATNGAGLKFSHHFGFGAVDAEAMVTRARHWINVPQQQTIHFPIQHHTTTIYSSDEINFTVSEGDIMFLEHVVITLTLEIHAYGTKYNYDDFYEELYGSEDSEDIYDWLRSPHPRRGDVELTLTSPSGTRSTLLPFRDFDFVNDEGYDDWPFMSVHFWGETPVGTWTLRTSYRSTSGHLAMKDVSVTMYGVSETPLSLSSIPNECHDSCARGCSAEGPENCDVCKNYRLLSTLECVEECPNRTRPYNHYCIATDSNEGSDSLQCPSEEQSHVIVGLSVVAVVLLVVLVLTVLVGFGMVRYRRGRRDHNRFRRLFNDTATVNS